MFSVDGLVSGLDTESIIEGSLSIQQSRIDRLTAQKAEYAQEQTAFDSIETKLLSLQSSMSRILRSSNNAFDQFTAKSSDEELLAATSSSNSVAGTYRFRAVQLAQAHQLKSGGFKSSTEQINTGTIDIRVGDRAVDTIRIDDDNNTVEVLVDAINAGSADVSATLIDDGSDSETPLRILITSRHTGASNEISITNSLGGRRDRGEEVEATQPDFTSPAVQDALDAQVRIGNGEGAITIASDTNEFDDLIPGVKLDILGVDPDKDILVTVAADSSETVAGVQGFVDAYNDVVEFIGTNSKYDSEKNSAGLLLGNRTAASVLSNLQSAINSVVGGVNESLNTLTAIGISTEDDGKLSLDVSQLTAVLDGEVDGVGVDDIRRLFATDGQSDNRGVEFILGTARTQPSPTDPITGELLPYEVEITRAAEKANLVGAGDLAETMVIDNSNNELTLSLDSVEIAIEIPEGSYTQDELAKQLKTLVNSAPDIGSREATFAVEDGKLSIESASYGRSSKVEILSGSAISTLGLTEGQLEVGVDVAGVFRIEVPGEDEKITEQATGNGRLLSGARDNEYTGDMQVRSTLLPRQITESGDANLTVTRGLGAALDAVISDLVDADGGTLSSTQDGLARQIESIDVSIGRLEEQLEARRERLTAEFAALESTLAELQSAGDTVTSGLNSLVTS